MHALSEEIELEISQVVFTHLQTRHASLSKKIESLKTELARAQEEETVVRVKLDRFREALEARQVFIPLSADLNGGSTNEMFSKWVEKRFFENWNVTPTGRLKRGEAQELVSKFLQVKGREGARLQDISQVTKTPYPTAHRIVYRLKARHQADQTEDGKWCWIGPIQETLSEAKGENGEQGDVTSSHAPRPLSQPGVAASGSE